MAKKAAKASKPKSLQIVAILWTDTVMDLDDEKVDPADALTFGILLDIDEKKQCFRLASEIFDMGDARSISAIPFGVVKAVFHYPFKDLPESFASWHPKNQ